MFGQNLKNIHKNSWKTLKYTIVTDRNFSIRKNTKRGTPKSFRLEYARLAEKLMMACPIIMSM